MSNISSCRAPIAQVAEKLPADYSIEAGGTIEESAKGLNSIVAVFPLMIILMLIILMVHVAGEGQRAHTEAGADA